MFFNFILRRKRSQPSFRGLAAISLILHVSLLAYMGILYYLASHVPGWTCSWSFNPKYRLMAVIFAVLIICEVRLIVKAPRRLFRSLTKKNNALQGTPANGIGLVQEAHSVILNFESIDQRVTDLTITRLALAQSIGIYGLVLAFLNKSVAIVFPFIGVALVLQIIFGPYVGRWFNRRHP